MFSSARIKLTFWYLLIITLIVTAFSVFIYQGITREINRVVRIQRIRMENPEQFIPTPQLFYNSPIPAPRRVDLAVISEAQERIKVILVLIDLGILTLSAFASYFLAGRTLKPIEEMVEDQKQFIADASHELRTPLTALKTEIEVGLRDKKLTMKQAKNLLESNLEEVDKMKTLSDYLLTLSRYQSDGGNLQRQDLLNQTVINEAVSRVKLLAKQKKIKVKSNVDKTSFLGNGKSLVELLVILLDNAIKFSPKGSSVTIRSKKINNGLTFEVEDQGIGIPKEQQELIFNRFHQASKSKSDEGFGLGLSIAKRIVELHNGTIWVKSEVKKGTTFSVRLPMGNFQLFLR